MIARKPPHLDIPTHPSPALLSGGRADRWDVAHAGAGAPPQWMGGQSAHQGLRVNPGLYTAADFSSTTPWREKGGILGKRQRDGDA